MSSLTLNLPTTTIVAPPGNASKWHMGFNSAFKGLKARSPNCEKGLLPSSCQLYGTTRLPLDGFSWNLVFENFSKKSVRKFQVSLKSDKYNWYCRWGRVCILICRWIILVMRNFSDKSCRENQNTHFFFNKSFSKNHAVYEIMWKNIVQPDRPQMATWRMRIEC